jgi:ketosteroid isomerase-like protein
MVEHQNALLLRQAWQAVAEGDSETLQAIWDDDVTWHVTADNPWHGDHVGHAAIIEYLAQVGEAGEAYETSLEEILVGDQWAAMVCHVHAKRGDQALDTGQLLPCRFEEGRMREVWTLSLDPNAINRFWQGA